MATPQSTSLELTLPELVEALPGLLAGGYAGAASGRVRDLPDARTVRWYQTLGMIDRPVAFRGRTALYGRRHLLQLAAIKKLQSSGFSLSDVQRGLAGRNDAELARSAGVSQKDAERTIEAAVLARSRANAASLAAAVAGKPARTSRRDTAFWKLPSKRSGMQSASVGAAGMLLWNGRSLTPAERAMLARLTTPLVSFLESVQSSAAGTQAAGAPRAASSPVGRKKETDHDSRSHG